MTYFWTRFLPSYATVLVYMLQDTEYRLGAYLQWYGRTRDFRTVMKRRTLDKTAKARLLLLAIRLVALVFLGVIATVVYVGVVESQPLWFLVAAGLFVSMPVVLAYGITVPLFLGWIFIQKPQEARIIRRAEHILRDHPAKRIAVVGSFGKTTAKELLKTVLGEGLHVAATPGNMNTPIGISRFARKLQGDEAVLIFELGEEKPGDVRRLSRLVRPEMAIVTGINEAHLSSFKTLEQTAATIFEIEDFVEPTALYKNEESALVKKYKNKSTLWFSQKGVGSWKTSKIETGLTGTSFTMKRSKETLRIETGLLGAHTVGVTAAVAAIAHDLGVSADQIEAGMRQVVPFEHRMEPRPLHGAWIIDDTYNGNSQGVAAGLEFLKKTGATRRVYVTPGLVEQGSKTIEVHETIGKQIAGAADVAVLMENSVTEHILRGLHKAKFKGQITLIDNPLQFYTNLDQFVAAGDVVLMQNDWTDNYQ